MFRYVSELGPGRNATAIALVLDFQRTKIVRFDIFLSTTREEHVHQRSTPFLRRFPSRPVLVCSKYLAHCSKLARFSALV